MNESSSVSKPTRPKFVPFVLTDEKRDELEEAHEDILVLNGGDMAPWLVVVRRPTRAETLMYKQSHKRESSTSNEQLIRKIAVFPDISGMDAQLARWPFLVDGIADNERFKSFLGLAVDAQLK